MKPSPGNVVLDIDGCLTLGGRAVPGAAGAVAHLRRVGIRIVIATNNSTRSADQVATRLGDLLGCDIPADWVVTSAGVAAGMLGPSDSPVLVVGEEGLYRALASRGLAVTDDPDTARSVVVGLDRSFDYARLRAAARAVRRGARFVASNDDATFPDPGGDVPGAGALLAAIEAAAGRRAEVAGKPHPPMLTEVAARLGPGPTWVVGDRPETDLALAAAGGWIGVLVLTGVTPDPTGVVPAPQVVLASVADLPPLLDR